MVKKQRNITLNRRDAFIRLALALTIIALVNVVAQFYYLRFDLTSEKRYSISKPSKQLVKNLKDVVIVKVYLAGDLNAGFKRLQESTRNTLNELRAYGGKNIEYEFIDPMAIENLEERKVVIQDLASRGVMPKPVKTQSKTGSTEQFIFPGALVIFGGREIPVNLLEDQIGYSPYEALNNSTILLEYKFVNAISKLTQYRPPQVGFVEGNGELSSIEVADIQETLREMQYDVKRFDLRNNYHIPERFDAMVIAKPRIAFDEKDKFKIDQYIMRGGKVLWLVDGTNATMDSLRESPVGQFAVSNDLNLDDMFFKYGIRLNTDVVQDINLYNQIPLTAGGQPQMFPWYYFPLLVSGNKHAIVRNLDPVAGFFVSTIDTIKNPAIRKTILLNTSEYAKAQLAPTRIHFGILQSAPNREYYNQSELPAAVLLEGQFESAFKNRLSPDYIAASDTVAELKFVEQSKPSRMIVIADGDIIRNEVRSDSSTYPLGYYNYTKQQFANKDFILNCIEYLIDNNGILETRNKEVKLRLLNGVKVNDEKLQWQLINIVLPISVVILFGVAFGFYRRKKYAA